MNKIFTKWYGFPTGHLKGFPCNQIVWPTVKTGAVFLPIKYPFCWEEKAGKWKKVLTIEKGSVGGERAKGKPTDALKMTVEG